MVMFSHRKISNTNLDLNVLMSVVLMKSQLGLWKLEASRSINNCLNQIVLCLK